MPVWHTKTQPFREFGELTVIGITQEQHPDRCALYAQWQGIEWPILWDPFNLTESFAVPLAMSIDENGVIRSMRLNPGEFDAQVVRGFLTQDATTPSSEDRPDPGVYKELCGPAQLAGADMVLTPEHAMSRALFYEQVHGTELPRDELDHLIASMDLAADGGDPATRFRLGVAYRLRYDSPHHRPGDFQASVDQWLAALLANPNQYIWRRRIQQWGPRLDKPYPFYDWVDRAGHEITRRGGTPTKVLVPLTGSEVAGKTNEIPTREVEAEHPDPGRKVNRDEATLIQIESAAALHTGVASNRSREPVGTSRVHVVLRPSDEKGVQWGNDAGPTQVWIALPEGWSMRQNLHTLPIPEDEEASSEVRQLDFEVRPPPVALDGPPAPPKPATLRGVAFYYVCKGDTGQCLYLAQDFEVPIPMPRERR